MLLSSRLYLVLDKENCFPDNVIDIFRQVNQAGIDLVQLRETTACDRDFLKHAEIIKRLCQQQGVIFLINNRLDIALIAAADGLHLGQSDLPLSAARRMLGKNKIIGKSCRNLPQALKAQAEGADYISIGPIFPTLTKPDLTPINLKILKRINQKIKIPFFAIGGINRSNINEVISHGVRRVALSRAICRAKNIKNITRALRSLIFEKPLQPLFKNDAD